MLSESPPRNKRVIVNIIESVPKLRRELSHIIFTACGEPRQRMTEVCAFFLFIVLLLLLRKYNSVNNYKKKSYEENRFNLIVCGTYRDFYIL